jgi:hypothetical protein
MANQHLDPFSLLPEQIGNIHLSFPSLEDIERLKPKDPTHIAMLSLSSNMVEHGAIHVSRRPKEVAHSDAPVLVMKKRTAQVASAPDIKPSEDEDIDDFFNLIERSLDRT